MTRPTNIGRSRPLLSAFLIGNGGSSGQVPTANGSNGVYFGENVARISANGSNALLGPFVSINSGTGVTLAVSSNTLTISTSSGGYTDPLTTRGDLVVRSAAATTRLALGADGRVLASDGTDSVWEAQYASIVAVIDGGGSAITTGIKGDIRVPFGCVIERASLLADQTGSIVVDIWVDTYANYPPTVADTITASAKPTLSSANKASDTTLTGWTTTLAEGSTIRYNVDSITTCTRVTVELKVRKT